MDKQDDKQERVIPKLRFPEFQTTLGWKPSSISKTCRSFSGGTPNTANKHFYGGKIPFIRSAEIALEKTELFLTEEGLNNSSAKMVNKGDVLVALYGANSGNVALSKIDGAINQAILCLQHQNNNAFLYHFLSYNQEKIVNTYIQGGQGNLSGEIIKSIKLPFPSPKEQQKIADCLSSIDELIELQEQKLAALKQHKKGLMQQLFPSHNDLQASKQASKQASNSLSET
ncbi:MAG: restriction endonuclease subunit S [Haemophilus parainfluenzae]|nr:restriction endonuclease subunit S [Haemophilus parainfluenzae]